MSNTSPSYTHSYTPPLAYRACDSGGNEWLNVVGFDPFDTANRPTANRGKKTRPTRHG